MQIIVKERTDDIMELLFQIEKAEKIDMFYLPEIKKIVSKSLSLSEEEIKNTMIELGKKIVRVTYPVQNNTKSQPYNSAYLYLIKDIWYLHVKKQNI